MPALLSFFASEINCDQMISRIDTNNEGGAKVRVGKNLFTDYLTTLNDWKSAGRDELHLGMPEGSQSHEAIIFEKSCMTGEVPVDWTKANITPNFKSGNL